MFPFLKWENESVSEKSIKSMKEQQPDFSRLMSYSETSHSLPERLSSSNSKERERLRLLRCHASPMSYDKCEGKKVGECRKEVLII